jgi:hypothetical protein
MTVERFDSGVRPGDVARAPRNGYLEGHNTVFKEMALAA